MIDLQSIRSAAAAIAPHILRTPLRISPHFSDKTGFEVHLKLENWQPTGAFKVRGALNIVRSLSVAERLQGLVAWSAGNHALGVAYAASIYETSATIFIPKKTPRTKVEKLRYFPAARIEAGETYEDCERLGRQLAEKEGCAIVHPYDDWRTVAGQGTIGLEICEAMQELDAIIVPVGGGGLISGVAIAAKSLDPEIRIIAVQSANSPSLQMSLRDQICYEEYPVEHSIAEGLAGGIGKIVYELAPKWIDEVINVEETAIPPVIAELLRFEQMVIEASAAASLSALPQIESVPRGSRIAVILSGGNLDLRLLKEIVREM